MELSSPTTKMSPNEGQGTALNVKEQISNKQFGYFHE